MRDAKQLHGGENCWHVVTSFLWQQAQAAQLNKITGAGSFDCALNPLLTSVVSREGKRPGAKLLVEISQITRGRASGPIDIQSLVPGRSDDQSVPTSGVGHQLPKSQCAFG